MTFQEFYLQLAEQVLSELPEAQGLEHELEVVETSLLPCTEKPDEPSTPTPASPRT